MNPSLRRRIPFLLAAACAIALWQGVEAKNPGKKKSPWQIYFTELKNSPELGVLQQLNINHSDFMVSHAFVQVMKKTKFSPEILKAMPTEDQVRILKGAIRQHAAVVLEQYKQGQLKAELLELQYLKGALTERQQIQLSAAKDAALVKIKFVDESDVIAALDGSTHEIWHADKVSGPGFVGWSNLESAKSKPSDSKPSESKPSSQKPTAPPPPDPPQTAIEKAFSRPMGWLLRHPVPGLESLAVRWLGDFSKKSPTIQKAVLAVLSAKNEMHLWMKALEWSPGFSAMAAQKIGELTRKGGLSSKHWDRLEELMASGPPHVRANAMRANRSPIGDSRFKSAYIQALSDTSPIVRREAARQLIHYRGSSYADEALRKALEDPDAIVRAYAILVSRSPAPYPEAWVRDLLEFWKHADDEFHGYALRFLGSDKELPAFAVEFLAQRFKDQKAIKQWPELLKALVSQRSLPEPTAREILSSLRAPHFVDPDIAFFVLRHPDGHPHASPYLRQSAVNSLGEKSRLSSAQIDILAALLDDADPGVRLGAMQALMRRPPIGRFESHPRFSAQALERIKRMFTEGSGELQLGALTVLSAQGHPIAQEAEASLVAGLRHSDPLIRRGIAQAFLNLPVITDPLLGYLFEALQDADVQVRAFAIAALTRPGPSPDRQCLLLSQVLDHADSRVRMAASNYLMRLPSMPEPVLADLKSRLSRQTEVEKRKPLLILLEKWLSVGELFSLLRPEYASKIAELIPGNMRTMGQFNNSPFVDLQVIDDALNYLAELKRYLEPHEFQEFVSSFENLSSIRSKVLIAPGRSVQLADGYYELPFPVPGLKTSPTPKPALLATLHPGKADKHGKEQLLKTVEAFDALIDSNFQALGLLARSAGALDKITAKALLEHVSRMVESYKVLNSRSGQEAAEKFEQMREELGSLWAEIPDRAALPSPIAARVSELEPDKKRFHEIRNLHTLINLLHQNSFKSLTAIAQGASADGSLRVGQRKFSFTNLNADPLVEKARLLNPLLGRLATSDVPSGNTILKDDQIWYHAQLGCHSVEVYAKFAEPDDGGMFRVRYSEGGSDSGNQRRLIYISELLRLLGVPSEIEGKQFLNCLWDKDHGLLSKSQIEDVFLRFLKGLEYTGNLDLTLQGMKENVAQEIAKGMAVTFIAQGSIPFYNDGLQNAYKKYLEGELSRAAIRDALNRELSRLGLEPISESLPFGQQVIDKGFTKPVQMALARGQLRLDASGVPQPSEYRPIEAMAEQIRRDPAAAMRMAALLAGAPFGGWHRESIGGIGRLKAERLQWFSEGKDGIVVYLLRDPATRAPSYATAQRWDGARSQPLDESSLVEELRRRGLETEAGAAPSRLQQQKWQRLLAAEPPAPEPGLLAQGLAASAGEGSFVTARAVFRKDRDFEAGGILIAPFTTPDDLEFMRQSVAVLTTGGGLLSHAAITTRELGIPATILQQARWGSEDGRPVLEIEIERPSEASRSPDGLWLTRKLEKKRLRVREGELLRLDGRRGIVELFHPEGEGAPGFSKALGSLHGVLREFGAGRGDAAALVALLGRLRGPPQLAAARFVLEEALGSRSLQPRRDEILQAVLGVSPALRAQLASDASAMLGNRLRQIDFEMGSDRELSEQELAKLKEQHRELSALAAALQLDLAPLEGFKARLERSRTLSEIVKRNSRLTMAPTIRVWAQQVESLQATDLPRLRALLRNAVDPELAQEAAAIRRKAEELARIKKERILKDQPAVIALDKLDDDFTELVGGKSAKLGEIMQVVLREGGYVPEGVALTTNAYLRFLREQGIEKAVLEEARELDDFLSVEGRSESERAAFVREKSARIQNLIRSAGLEAAGGLGKEILDSLRDRQLFGVLFAVRSSAVQEDRQEAAFAGAAETYLYVDFEGVLEKVVENWASFWLPRGILYRWQQGIRSADLRPAVTIQKMADVDAAGVMFTVNPVDGRDDIVINAAFGLGEGIVSGVVQADQYLADRDGEEIEPPVLGNKSVKVVRKNPGPGTEIVSIPSKQRLRRTLRPEHIRRLALLGAALEEHFGYPLDIEFGIEGDRVVILQARPVTVSGVRGSPAG